MAATLIVLLGGGEFFYLLQKERLEARVERRIAELEAVFRDKGAKALADAVHGRERTEPEAGLSFRYTSAQGDTIAGRLEASAPRTGWFEFVPVEDEDEVHSAKAVVLADGAQLIVSYDPEPLYDVRELTLAGTFWTLAISLPLALICGAVVSTRVVRRIKLISETTEQVSAGGLSARVPVSAANDEFDRLATNVNRMLESIGALTKNLENVAVGIAHDLRTPLSRVRNRLELLKGAAADREQLDAKVDEALAEIGAVLATFDALLRIGQIDAGTQRAGFRTVDLSRLVSEIADTYGVVASDQGRTLAAHIAPGIELHGDRALLAQMFANTLDNAIQHTPERANITVRLTATPDGRIEAAVCDDGRGIPEHQRDEVLRPFRSLDQNGGRNHGLGLSIVHAIARLHGLEMRLESNHPGLRVVFASPPAR